MKGLEKIRIDELVPEQLRDVAQNLIDFLKVYYSEDVNPTKYIEELTQSRDIDKVANDDFLEQLAQTIAKDIPDSAVVQKTFLLKRLVDYYNLKGTNQSVIIFFQLFYDKVAKVFEPWNVVLESSSNKIIENKFIRIRPASGQDPLSLEGKDITLENEFGTILASGKVNRVSVEQYEEVLYTLHFDTGSTTGAFSKGVSVISNEVTYGTSVESLQSINIIDGGSGFDRGDILFLKDEPLTTFEAKLISTDIDGRALKFEILQRGNGDGSNVSRFVRGTTRPKFLLRKADGRVLNPTTLGAGVRMSLEMEFSILCESSGFGSQKNKGLLSNNIVLQDGNYYSKYTYEVKVQIPFTEYKDSFNNLIHPVGYNIFNNLVLENVPPLSFDIASSITEINTVGTSNFLPGGTNREYSLFGSKMSDATPDEVISLSPSLGIKRDNYSVMQSPYTATINKSTGSTSMAAYEYLNAVTGTSDYSPFTVDYFMEDYSTQSPNYRVAYVTNSTLPVANGRYLPGSYLSPRIIAGINASFIYNIFPARGKINGYVYYVQDTSPSKGIIFNPVGNPYSSSTSAGQWRLSYYSPTGGVGNIPAFTTVALLGNNTTNFNQPLDRPRVSNDTTNVISYNEIVNDDSFVVENR